ncbi:MAG TPA: two component regulator propeller, partial [Prevotella sp.]|nr:two component regulator propeller [Prevotella sp.]
KEMKEELSNNHSGKLTKENIYRMLNHITDDIDNDTYWDMYQKNFDLIHKNFFRNLRKINPELTATDLKFCALLRLNRSTKEIALFTGLTTRGVEGARYRLRKKLDIPKGQSIVQFLLMIN